MLRCNLIPLTGTVTLPGDVIRGGLLRMQPYTPHGDSNVQLADEIAAWEQMQPYTPHGDSNSAVLTTVAPS